MSDKVQRKCTQEGVFFVACIASKASVNSNKSIYVHDGARVSNRVRYLQRLRIRPGVNSPSLHPPSKVLRKDSSTKPRSEPNRDKSDKSEKLGIPTSLLLSIWSCQTSAMAPWTWPWITSSIQFSTGECTSKSKCQRKKKDEKSIFKNCWSPALLKLIPLSNTEHLAHHLLPPDLVWICRMLHQPWVVTAGNFSRHTPWVIGFLVNTSKVKVSKGDGCTPVALNFLEPEFRASVQDCMICIDLWESRCQGPDFLVSAGLFWRYLHKLMQMGALCSGPS